MSLQDDLTNLNWVAGAPVPIPSVSPPGARNRLAGRARLPSASFLGSTPTRTVIATTPKKTKSVVWTPMKSAGKETPKTPARRSLKIFNRSEVVSGKRGINDRPRCSYTCLIGMAMNASPGTDGCLPVQEIYRYIEKKFPYFKTAPDGWKNSIRHNLSLNPLFRKVTRDGWQGKKGFFWEMTPEKKKLVDDEVQRFLDIEGTQLELHTTTLKSPLPPSRHGGGEKVKRKLEFSRSSSSKSETEPPSPPRPNTPTTVREYSKEIQEQLLNSDVSIVPTQSPTQSALDTSEPPSSYIGIEQPPKSPNKVAKDLFPKLNEPAISIKKDSDSQDKMLTPSIVGSGYDPNMVPVFAPAPYCGMFGVPPHFFAGNALSPVNPIMSPTCSPPALTPMGSPYVSPQYVQYVPFNPYMGMVPSQPMFLSPPPETFLHTPVSVEILDSSQEMEIGEVIELVDDNVQMCTAVSNTNNNGCYYEEIRNPSQHGAPVQLQANDTHYDLNIVNEGSNGSQDNLCPQYSANSMDIESIEHQSHEFQEGVEFLRSLSQSDILSLLKDVSQHQQARNGCINSSTTEPVNGTNEVSFAEEFTGTSRMENMLLNSYPQSQENYANKQQCADSKQADDCSSEFDLKIDCSQPRNADGYSLPRIGSLMIMDDRNIECIRDGMSLNTGSEVSISTSNALNINVESL